MILDRSWNKRERKLVISYIDKGGRRQFYQKFFHHIKTYEYDLKLGMADVVIRYIKIVQIILQIYLIYWNLCMNCRLN